MVPIVNKTQFENFQINIIDNREKQNQIVKVLKRINNVIDMSNRQIEKLDNLIKSRFVEMFGDPVYNPMKWPIKKLSDLSLQINSGNTPKGGERQELTIDLS